MSMSSDKHRRYSGLRINIFVENDVQLKMQEFSMVLAKGAFRASAGMKGFPNRDKAGGVEGTRCY